MISLEGPIDDAEPLAEIVLPVRTSGWTPEARVFQAGNLLVVLTMTTLSPESTRPDAFDVMVWDFSNPLEPELVSTLESEELFYDWQNSTAGTFRLEVADILTLDDALVVLWAKKREEIIGTLKTRLTYPVDDYGDDSEAQFQGSVHCQTTVLESGQELPETCYGSIQSCSTDNDGHRTCEPMDRPPSRANTHNEEEKVVRHWGQYHFNVLDLRDPAAPAVQAPIIMPEDEEAVAIFVKDNTLYYTYKQPHYSMEDGRPFMRHFFKAIDLSDPAAPTVSESVQIPGRLLNIDGDRLLTQGLLNGETIVETAISVLELDGNRAYLTGIHRFKDHAVPQVTFENLDDIIILHHPYDDWQSPTLTRLSTNSGTLDLVSQTPTDEEMLGGALFMNNGYLERLSDTRFDIMDIDTGGHPELLSSFPNARSWWIATCPATPWANCRQFPRGFRPGHIHGDEPYFVGGQHGMHP